MLPITSPIIYTSPVTIGAAQLYGRTQPFQMVCESVNGQTDYIVKLWANPEVYLGKHSLAREVYGSLLARSFGLQTPDIAIVEISPEFYKSQPADKADLIKRSAGLNFGSKFLPGAMIFSPPVPPNKHPEAVKVFCFDMLLCNQDRRIDKPNVFDMPDGFVVIDHEQAFPYSRPNTIIGGCPPCWQYIREPWHKNHIFYPSIRKRDCYLEIEEFMTLVGCLSEEFLITIEEQIPEEWNTGNDLQNIRNYLANTRDNADNFKRSLQEILA